jgi:hypothetical protein
VMRRAAGQGHNIQRRGVALAALYTANVVCDAIPLVQPAFLATIRVQTERANVFSKHCPWVGGRPSVCRSSCV